MQNTVVVRNVRPRENLVYPTYTYQWSETNGEPHILTMRPVFRGGYNADEQETRMFIADALNDRIVDRVRRSGMIGNRAQLMQSVTGSLIAYSTDEGPERSATLGRSIRLNELTPEVFEEMMETITQSETNTLIYEVEWRFVINPRSLRQGGSSNVKPPKWLKIVDQSWKSFKDDKGPVSCAAIALVLAMNGSTKPYVKYKSFPARLIKVARKFQELMGWGEFVSGSELAEFVKKYPKYRLSILMAEKSSRYYTYEGSEFVAVKKGLSGKLPSPFYLYIYFDTHQKHYAAVRHPQEFYAHMKNTKTIKFCHDCVEYFQNNCKHSCESNVWEPKKRLVVCSKCGLLDCKDCDLYRCRGCEQVFSKNSYEHRCMIIENEAEEVGYNLGENDCKKPSLWVYDLESRIQTIQQPRVEIKTLVDGYYSTTSVDFIEVCNKQVANYVYAINVFTNEKIEFFGEDCLDNFITYMANFNNGNSIILAHNGAGYDTRLIFEKLVKRNGKFKLNAIMNGSKINQLKMGKNLLMRDTKLHLTGSVKALAKDFLTPTQKGDFPHLFNTIENYDYAGKIPDKSYYDLSSFKSEDDVKEFDEWYAQQIVIYDGEVVKWIFKDQLKAYCKNDVEVLADVVLKYHNIYMEKFKLSPWKSMTSSSYFHKISKIMVTRNMELPFKDDDNYKNILEQKVKENWAILRPAEYATARAALRGGRTGIGRIICELTPEEIDRGCEIRYVDVVSLYPYQQVAHDFPVGFPTIHVFDEKFTPCYKHKNLIQVECDCEPKGYTETSKYFNIKIHKDEWDKETLLSKHGFVIATVQPPMMLHPILVRYDEKEKKCNTTCEVIEKGCFTSIEFHTALKHGYKVLKLHRFDEYQMAPPLWEDFVKEMYIFKLVNSSAAPKVEDRQTLINFYEDKFEMGDLIRKTFNPDIWSKNPARKAAAKTGLNSGWGKHAQRPIMSQTAIIDYQDGNDTKDSDILFGNIMNNVTTLQSALQVDEKRFMYTYKNDLALPNFRNSYLPAACFVPAYGRLQLWDQLHKLGDRVLMFDTDSVVYIYEPDKYNVQESKIWGEWEAEDISQKGITGFIGLGPKSYAMRCKEEKYNVVKLKGISQKRATDKLLNYETMKKLVVDNLVSKNQQQVKIPQTIFDYKFNRGIYVKQIQKILSFDFNSQKGLVGQNMFLYPRGYNGADFTPFK